MGLIPKEVCNTKEKLAVSGEFWRRMFRSAEGMKLCHYCGQEVIVTNILDSGDIMMYTHLKQ